MPLSPEEKLFVKSIKDKIENYNIPITFEDAIKSLSGIILTTKYNNGKTELVDVEIEKFLIRKSCNYFIRKYAIISMPGLGYIPFDMYYVQEKAVEDFQNNKFNILLKTRQIGASTVTALYSLWKMLDDETLHVIDIISATGEKAKEFKKKMNPTLSQLPLFLFPKVIDYRTREHRFIESLRELPTNNTTQLEFSNGSKFKCEMASENAGRSDSLSLLILDEAAFFKTATLIDEIWKSAGPTLSKTKGDAIVISCYTKDTYIYTENGIEQIENYIPKNCKLGFNDIKQFKIDGINHNQNCNKFYDSGITPTKIITTQNNFNLEVSGIHPIYIVDENNCFPFWKQAKDIEIGNYICFSNKEKTFGTNDYIGFDWVPKSNWRTKHHLKNFNGFITEDLAYFFGLLIGNGYYNEKGQYAIITSTDEEIKDWLLNNKYFLFRFLYRKEDSYHFRTHGKYLISLLKYLGFDKQKAKNKTIPKKLLQMSRNNMVSLLKGLFDSNGHSRTRDGSIGFSSTSEKLIEQIKIILNQFGIQILNERWNEVKPTKKVSVFSNKGQITLSKYFSKIFYEKIGFKIKRKNKYNLVKNIQNISSKYPFLNFYINNLCKKYKIKIKHNLTKYKSMSKNKLEKILQKIKKKDILEYKKLNDFINKDYHFVKIKKIKDSKNHTYDFVIPETRSLYANGIIGSNTPNGTAGKGKWYYKMWNEAMSGNGEFNPITIDWWEIPEEKKGNILWLNELVRNDYYYCPEIRKEGSERGRFEEENIEGNIWLKEQRDLQGLIGFKQEILHDFISTGESIFTTEKLKAIEANLEEPIKKDELMSEIIRGLWIWEFPQKNKKYIIAVDSSRGSGKDASAIQVIDPIMYTQIAEFRGYVSTKRLGMITRKIAKYYNNAYLIIECNNLGEATFNEVYYSDTDPYENIYRKSTSRGGNNITIGWDTTPALRRLITDEFMNFINDEKLFKILKIKSRRLYEEMCTWIWDGGKPTHASGMHDDTILSFCIALFNRNKTSMQDSFVISSTEEVDYSKITDEDIQMMKEKYNKFEDDNKDIKEIQEDRQADKMINRYGVDYYDYSWLLGFEPEKKR